MLAEDPPSIHVARIKHDDVRAFEVGWNAPSGLSSSFAWRASHDELSLRIDASKVPDHRFQTSHVDVRIEDPVDTALTKPRQLQ